MEASSLRSLCKWLGYLEHATPEDLQHPTINVGRGNCTIFADMVRQRTGIDLQGLPWCATFVFAVHPNATTFGEPVPGVKTLMRRAKARGLWRGRDYDPREGDLVFVRTPWFVHHVGIVLEVDDETIISIDGNTSDPSGIFRPGEGGAVALRIRSRKGRQIAGYAVI